jgi:hypothetical protein
VEIFIMDNGRMGGWKVLEAITFPHWITFTKENLKKGKWMEEECSITVTPKTFIW